MRVLSLEERVNELDNGAAVSMVGATTQGIWPSMLAKRELQLVAFEC